MNDSTTWSPGRDVLDAGTDFGDDAGALVTAEHREAGHRDAAGDQVMVGVAHSRRFHLDLDFVLDCGSPISISSIDHGWLNSQIRAPLVFTLNLLSSLRRRFQRRPELHASNALVECRTAGDPITRGAGCDHQMATGACQAGSSRAASHRPRLRSMRFCIPSLRSPDSIRFMNILDTCPKSKKSRCHSIFSVAVEAEPAAADAVDLVLAAVGLVDDLLPEADDFALLVVDQDLLVLVHPVLQAFHFQTQRDVADLVDGPRTSRLPWGRCSSRRWRPRCRNRPAAFQSPFCSQTRFASSHRSTQSSSSWRESAGIVSLPSL